MKSKLLLTPLLFLSGQVLPGTGLTTTAFQRTQLQISSLQSHRSWHDEYESSSSFSSTGPGTGPLRPVAVDYVDARSYWVYMYYLLMVYKAREGHVHVPHRHVEQGWQLGAWLCDQRGLYHKNMLNPERQERLEMAGIAWNLHDRKWEIMLEALEDFISLEGHPHVPQRYYYSTTRQELNNTTTKAALGTWLNTQRTLYKNNQLDPTRQARLQALGVAWSAHEAQWETMYTKLQKYHQREQHAQVPASHNDTPGEESLGMWLASQRKFWRKGTLTPQRQAKLKQLGVSAYVITAKKSSSSSR